MNEKPITIEECIHDRKEMQKAVKKLSNEVMPTLWTQLKWRFVCFWASLWACLLLDKSWIWLVAVGLWGLLVARSIFNLCDCRYCIANTKETIAYIEGVIKEKERE